MSAALRPRFWPYLKIWILLAALWSGFIVFGYYQLWDTNGLGAEGLGKDMRNGVLAVTGVLILAFAGHWLWRVRSAVPTAVATPAAAPVMAASAPASSPRETMLAGQGEHYVLEVRGLGLAVGDFYQTVWQAIQEANEPFKSVLPQDPAYYDPNTRLGGAGLAASSSFGYATKEAVERWPVPVILLGPPNGRGSSDRPVTMANNITAWRQAQTLGASIFLWQADTNASNAQAALAQIFKFFDENHDIPEALIVSNDSESYRYLWKSPGLPERPSGVHVPLLPDSMVTLLVTRSDRVDRLVRPYAVQAGENINKQDTQYDVTKLWNFYWAKRDAFDAQYEASLEAQGVDTPSGPGVPKADWWIKQLPELWKQIGNKGPGDFTPSPYLPVRWTDEQVKQFDDAPLLGYIHRPVRIPLAEDKGTPLKRAEQVEALRKGWQEALGTLTEGDKPSRVFYDTTFDREWVIPLTQALQGNAEGIELDDKHTGYDIGRRLGNTGVSSALVQLGLAIQSGYEDGRTSATINLTPDGYAGIVMVSPPDAASKDANTQRRGKNPFLAHVPSAQPAE